MFRYVKCLRVQGITSIGLWVRVLGIRVSVPGQRRQQMNEAASSDTQYIAVLGTFYLFCSLDENTQRNPTAQQEF